MPTRARLGLAPLARPAHAPARGPDSRCASARTTYLRQASTEAQTRGFGRNFSLGGFSASRIDAKSDGYVVTINPAFDANQIQKLIDATRQSANPTQLEGVVQQLERLGAISRSAGR